MERKGEKQTPICSGWHSPLFPFRSAYGLAPAPPGCVAAVCSAGSARQLSRRAALVPGPFSQSRGMQKGCRSVIVHGRRRAVMPVTTEARYITYSNDDSMVQASRVLCSVWVGVCSCVSSQLKCISRLALNERVDTYGVRKQLTPRKINLLNRLK